MVRQILAALPIGLCCCSAPYEARPWTPEEALAAVDDRRRTPVDGIKFASIADHAVRMGPAVRRADAALRVAQAASEHPTPLPNPTFSIGPMTGVGGDVSSVNRVMPFVSLTLQVPLSDRRQAEDELMAARAAAVWIDRECVRRATYLELRASWIELALAGVRCSLRNRLEQTANDALRLTQRLTDVGTANATTVGFARLRQQRARTAAVHALAEQEAVIARISAAAGLEPDQDWLAASMPDVPSEVPDRNELRAMLLRHRSDLAQARADYEVREKELWLEVERNLPDLQIGGSAQGEPGERRMNLGLTLGLPLPIFDGNERAIAVAEARREQERVRYESELNGALSELGLAERQIDRARDRVAAAETLLEQARQQARRIERALEAGTADTTLWLESRRGLVDAELDHLDARSSLLRGWLALERAVGHPLFTIPGEAAPGSTTPYPKSREGNS